MTADGFCFEEKERRRKGCGRSAAVEAPMDKKLMMMVGGFCFKEEGRKKKKNRRKRVSSLGMLTKSILVVTHSNQTHFDRFSSF